MKSLFILILLIASFAGGVYAGQTISFDFKGMVDDLVSDVATSDETSIDDETTQVSETVDDTDDAAPESDTSTPAPAPASTNTGIDQYRLWISEARAQHPYSESEQKMFDVMMCESGGNADIVNPAGPYSGLFQYATPTWNGEWNTYRSNDIFDARAQIFATALAWNIGMQSHWGCYNRAH